MSDAVHLLVVGEWDENENRPEWDIKHPQGCDLATCPVHFQIEDAGIDAFGMTTSGSNSDWHIDPWPKGLPTAPGEYPFEFWHSKYYVWDVGAYEYNAGLALIEEEESAASE